MTVNTMTAALSFAALSISSCHAASSEPPALSDLADQWVDGYVAHEGHIARLYGVDVPVGQLLGDNSIEGTQAWRDEQRDILQQLDRLNTDGLDVTSQAVAANLRGKIEGNLAMEACRWEYLSLNHASGWHLNLMNTLGMAGQAAGENLTPELLQSYSAQLVDYIDQEEAALRAGLARGYSTPRGIALQVADQMESLPDQLLQLAGVLPEPLATTWSDAINNEVGPRFSRRVAFIRDEYAPEARETRSLSAHPDGEACYLGAVKYHTGTDLNVDELTDLAGRLRAAARERVSEVASALYGTTGFEDGIRAYFQREEAPFTSEAEQLAFAENHAYRLIETSAHLFPELPEQSLTVSAYPHGQRGGATANYQPVFDQGFAGRLGLNPDDPAVSTPSGLEQILSHEVAPGHHTQAMVGFAAYLETEAERHPILSIGFNGAFVEGWARYAELLTLEAGLLTHREGEIQLWRQYGATIPLELEFHFSQMDEYALAVDYIERTGRDVNEASLAAVNGNFDWMAVMPGQVIAYDFGGDFIHRLRLRAEQALGDEFDIVEFHRLILEEGSVPLARLETKIDQWIEGR